MNLKKIPTAFLMAVFLAGAAAHAAAPRSPGEVVDDAVVLARVKAALIENPATKARQIDVSVSRGVVQLGGQVDSHAERAQAGVLAQGIDGVTEVRNHLTVAKADRTVGQAIDDATVTTRVKAALAVNTITKARQINVETRQGVVQLHGFVDSRTEANEAVKEAWAIPGVHGVRNDLVVKPAS